MTQPISLIVESVQTDLTSPDGEPQTICLETQAEYVEKNGTVYILYEEEIEDSKETIQNRIKIKNETVELVKKGAVETVMRFQAGMEYASVYNTPFGAMLVDNITQLVLIEPKENGLNVVIKYKLKMNGELTTDCKLRVSVQ